MTRDTVETSSDEFCEEMPSRRRFLSPISNHLKDKNFLISWYRQPKLEIAEAVIRLRRLRGMTQEELATRMGKQQPAVARIEAGRSNLQMSTVVELAEALDAVIRIDLSPVEHLDDRANLARWWNSSKEKVDSEFRQVQMIVGNRQLEPLLSGSMVRVVMGTSEGKENIDPQTTSFEWKYPVKLGSPRTMTISRG
jgi:transcriptional regulator with XRE-family HTH domain